ncbi:phosphatidylinositol kinase- protein kinase tor1, partial [Cryomyces antarcticus]
TPPEPSFPSERRASIIGPEAMNTAGQSYQSLSDRRSRNRSMAQPNTPGAPLPNSQGSDPDNREVQNARALQVLSRVEEKLTGRDFKPDAELSVDDQVEKLLTEATSLENL